MILLRQKIVPSRIIDLRHFLCHSEYVVKLNLSVHTNYITQNILVKLMI